MKIIHKDVDENLVVVMTRGDWLLATGRAKVAEYTATDVGTEAPLRDFSGAEVRLMRAHEKLCELFKDKP